MIIQNIETTAEIATPANPFPGLRPFDFEESHLFFGRDGQSEQLITRLGRTRLLAVVGTSGSGKSSLVRAGLLPALLGGFMTSAGSAWRVAILRPGNDPMGKLAEAINAPDVFGSEDAGNQALQIAITEATVRRGSRGLIEAVRQNAMSDQENLLVVVDQFEELFRFAREAVHKTKEEGERYQNDAAAFVKLLLEAHRQRDANIYIVLTMRSDFLGDCAQFWDLPEAINEGQYLIPRLTRDQLREAITGPIAVFGGAITPRLVNRLLNDIGDDQDQLPVLQHLLMRVWDEWKEKRLEVEVNQGEVIVKQPHREAHQGEAIDLCCYEAVGGMAEALSRHADEAYHELPDDHHRLVAERLFKCLTERGEDNREIRRPIPLSDICVVTQASAPEVKTVIETFRRPGRSFLMPPAETPLENDSLIDISHESLIRGWQRLRDWVYEEARSARVYRRLAETAELYREGKAGLWRDPDLQIALDWQRQNQPNPAWARRYHPEFDGAVAFLEESQANRVAEIAEKERQERAEGERRQRELAQAQALAEEQRLRAREQTKSANRLRRLVAALIVMFLVTLVAAMLAFAAQRKAEAESKRANDQTQIAKERADSLDIALAKLKVAIDDAIRKRSEAEEAQGKAKEQASVAEIAKARAEAQARIARENEERAKKAETTASLREQDAKDALAIVKSQDHAPPYTRAVLRGSKGEVINAGFSDDGKKVITASFDRKARVWDVNTEAILATLQDDGMGNVSSAMFSPDGTRAVTISDDPTEKKVKTEKGVDIVKGVKKVIRIWDVSQRQPRKIKELPLQGSSDSVPSVSFSRDGRQLITLSGKTAEWWSTESGENSPLQGPDPNTEQVLGLADTPDGVILITAEKNDDKVKKNRVVQVLNVGNGQKTRLLGQDHTDQISSGAFSRDARRVITLSEDQTAWIWDVKTGRRLSTLKDQSKKLSSALLSPDGSKVLTVSEDKTAQLWDVSSNPARNIPLQGLGHTDKVLSAVFSPDGNFVATATLDNATVIWEASTGNFLRELRGHTSPVISVAFSPDTQLVVTTGDKTARVWEAAIGFDFVTRARDAEWVSAAPKGAGTRLDFGGSDGEAKGFVLWREGYRLEDGSVPSGKILETHPKWVDDGVISGLFPPYTVQPGDHFIANFGFLLGGRAGNVKIELNYLEDGKLNPVATWTKAYEGKLMNLDADLSALAGRRVQFALVALANGTSAQDWAVWVNPRIVRK